MLKYGAGKYRPKTCSESEQVYSPCLGLGKKGRILLNIILTVVYVLSVKFSFAELYCDLYNKSFTKSTPLIVESERQGRTVDILALRAGSFSDRSTLISVEWRT